MSEIDDLIEELKQGIEAEEFRIFASTVKGGRFREEVNLELSVEGLSGRDELLIAKIFKGRRRYIPWAELFGINPSPIGVEFFGSVMERRVLDLFGRAFPRLFVEYFEDRQTAQELKKGAPPILSRLGFELGKRGYTLVRDWYIPEGLMEGGHKLQGEKSRERDVLERRWSNLNEELDIFLERCNDSELRETVLKRFKILENLWMEFSGT